MDEEGSNLSTRMATPPPEIDESLSDRYTTYLSKESIESVIVWVVAQVSVRFTIDRSEERQNCSIR